MKYKSYLSYIVPSVALCMMLAIVSCTGKRVKAENAKSKVTGTSEAVSDEVISQEPKQCGADVKDSLECDSLTSKANDVKYNNGTRFSQYWMESDSIYASKVYEFNYTDGVFPCQDDCYIKGLDTDGNGKFYIAGGNPIRVVCYKGTKYLWSREISRDTGCCHGYFHLVGDSLYFIEETYRKVLRLHKDGAGDIETFTLSSIPANDSIEGNGMMSDDGYVILTMGRNRNYYKYKYPAELVDYIERPDLTRLDISVRPEDCTVKVYCRAGRYNGWLVYSSYRDDDDAVYDPDCGEEPGTVITLSADTANLKFFIQFPVGGLPFYSTKATAGYSSILFDAFRNGKLFYSGYDIPSKTFQIHEFDIDSLLKIIYRHPQYIARMSKKDDKH